MTHKICLTCPTGVSLTSKSEGIAQWLIRDGKTSAIPGRAPSKDLHILKKPMYPDSSSVEITVQVDTKSKQSKRMVFYWAAEPMSIKDKIERITCKKNPKTASEAYGEYSNSGTAYISDRGQLIVRLACPQPYSEANEIHPPHFHFVERDMRSRTRWLSTVHTVAAIPGLHEDRGYGMVCLGHGSNDCSILTQKQVIDICKHYGQFIYIVNAGKRRKCIKSEFESEFDQSHMPIFMRLPAHYSDAKFSEMCHTMSLSPCIVYGNVSKTTCPLASKLILRMIQLGRCRNVYYMQRDKRHLGRPQGV